MKNYDIVVVGARGSGKTVFLASMFHKLSTQRPDIRFFLTVPDNQRINLVRKYDRIADPLSDWPPATKISDFDQWNFTCRVKTDGGTVYDAFKFNYWDYSGELVTETDLEGNKSFQELGKVFRQAHALLGILDGQKILWLLKEVPSPTGSIYFDLGNILPVLEDNNNPVHFIISKWDVLAKHNYNLNQVRDRLLQYDQFRQFVEARRERNIPIRLIPVSAVGMDFVEMKATPDGHYIMEKRQGASPKPFQVEMPIACVIPDKLKVELERVKAQAEMVGNINTEVSPDLGFWDCLGMLIAGFVEKVRKALPEELNFADPVLKKLADFSESGARVKQEEARTKAERLRQERDASLKAVKDQESSMNHVVNSFLYIGETLKSKFPNSNLLYE